MKDKRQRYKKIVALILCLNLLIPCMMKADMYVFAATKGVCTASKLMIREEAGQDSNTMKVKGEDAYLVKDQVVDILGLKDGWYQIKAEFNGTTVEGYSLATYIKEAETIGSTIPSKKGVCTANTLMVRKGPGTEYDKVTVNGEEVYLTNGQSIEVLSEKDDWYQIKATFMGTTIEGYSSGTYITIVESVDEPTPVPTKAPESTIAPEPTKAPETGTSGYELKIPAKVTSSTLNLRKKAGTSSEIVATLGNNKAVTVIGETKVGSENWYKVTTSVAGKTVTGFVLSDYVKLTIGSGYYGQILTDNLTPVTEAGGSKSVKVADESVWKVNKGRTWISDEVTKDGQKWFRIGQSIDGVTYRGYVKAEDVKLLGKKTATPTPVPTEEPEATPEPTETPSPTPLPQPESNRGSIIGASALIVREEPGYSGGIVSDERGLAVLLAAGHPLKIHEMKRHDGLYWYSVSFDYNGVQYKGYVNEKYIQFEEPDKENDSDKQVEIDGDFESMLTTQGFPESYKTYLRKLHDAYPNWRFEAYHTGLDWNTVLDNEGKVGVNLISNAKGIEWKSLDEKAYNWKTDSFIVYDGSTWVTASREAVAYYMDPRNFLDADNIFQFEVLTYKPSYQDIEGVENILKNTALYKTSYSYVDEHNNTGTMSYGETFIKAAEYSGVSPYHLASRVKQEVITGTTTVSNSVTGTVSGFEGLYNFYNIGAYHSTVAGGSIANGLKYAKNGTTNAELNEGALIPWDNQYKSVVGGSYIIGSSYISRGQETIYLQKFNVTETSTYSHQYMANVEAPYAEGRKVHTAYGDDISSLPIVFSIPVYLNMPSKPASMPETKYNPNNWLASLKVVDMAGNNLLLTPEFDISSEQEYYLTVPYDTEYVNVTASAVSKKATVNGDGIYQLSDQNNLIIVYAIAENGDIREYKISVVKEN